MVVETQPRVTTSGTGTVLRDDKGDERDPGRRSEHTRYFLLVVVGGGGGGGR